MVKYFGFMFLLVLLFILVIAFFTGLYFRSYSIDAIITKPITENNDHISKKISKNILCKYHGYIDSYSKMSDKNLKKDLIYKKIEQIINRFTESTSAEIIKIRNSNNTFTYSNISGLEEIFYDKDSKRNIKHFKSFKPVSYFIKSLGFHNKNSHLKKGSFIHTSVKADSSACNTIQKPKNNFIYIIDFYNDVSEENDFLLKAQIVISSVIITLFLVLYLFLFLTSKRTERIINTQHDEKLKLEKDKSLAEARSQQKSMFLANVSHELRTPLNAIIGFSEIIKSESMGPVGHPQYKEYIADINTSGVHLLSLINDILDYSKAEAKKLSMEDIDVNLNKILQNCVRLIDTRAKEAGVKVIQEIPEYDVVFSADPKRMKQIILNILSNAVKFTPQKGTVIISITDDQLKGRIIIVVKDNGIGIAPKDLSRAMSPFGQIDSSVSRRFEGTGLGLPLTKKLTELMGGKFTIISELDLGTTIELDFPIRKQVDTEAAKKTF